jgi:WD40 repeat protein
MDSTHEIITANYQGTMLTWDDHKGIKKMEKLENNFITDFDFYFPGGFFIASSWDTSLKVIKIDDHKLISSCKSGDYKIRTVKYSEKTKSIYGGTTAGNLMKWPVDQCSAGSNYNQKVHKDAITSMDINEDMNLLVTASVDGQIKLLNLSTLKEIGTLKGHKSPVNAIKIIPQSLKIASGDKDGKIFIWDIKTHGYVALSAHQDSINTLDVSPDGKLVASGSSDRTVKVWNLRKILSAGK